MTLVQEFQQVLQNVAVVLRDLQSQRKESRYYDAASRIKKTGEV
jgi:hypothetical protein